MTTDHHQTLSRIDLSLVDNVNLIGRKIADRWLIVQLLGQGKMSTVYKAEEEYTHKPVVLKLIHKKLLQNVTDLRELEEGAQLLCVLSHSNIANFTHVYLSSNNEFFLICEYFEAESLKDIFEKNQRMLVEQATNLFIQAADALSYAHRKSILHNEIKPSNLRLYQADLDQNQIKIVDFGITQLLLEDRTTRGEKTQDTQSVEAFTDGFYYSPERCLGKPLDTRSDVYSLGCVMYECLNGTPPFMGNNLLQTSYKHIEDFPAAIEAPYQEGVFLERYNAVVMMMLEKNPADRYPSMAALKRDLEILLTANDSDWRATALVARSRVHAISQYIRPKLIGKISIGCLIIGSSIIGISYLANQSNHEQYPYFNNNQLWKLTNNQTSTATTKFDKPKQAVQEKLLAIERANGKLSDDYAMTLYGLCNIFMQERDWTNAILKLKELLAIRDKTNGTIDLADIYSKLATCELAKTFLETAKENCQLVLNLIENKKSTSVEAEISALNILGDIYTQRGDAQKAKDIYLKLYPIAERAKLKWPPVFGFACVRLGDTYRQLGELASADQYYKQGLDWWQNYVGDRKGTFLPRALYGYGFLLATEKQFPQAEQRLKEALPLAIANTGRNSALVGAIKLQYEECLFHTDLNQWLQDRLLRSDNNDKIEK